MRGDDASTGGVEILDRRPVAGAAPPLARADLHQRGHGGAAGARDGVGVDASPDHPAADLERGGRGDLVVEIRVLVGLVLRDGRDLLAIRQLTETPIGYLEAQLLVEYLVQLIG